MARIPEAEVERLKSEISLLRLVESAGVELKKQGKDYAGRCPFHDDRTPSLIVSPDKNLWHCLGACQTGGSVIDWTMKLHGVSFRHACELLRDDPSLAAAAPSSAGVKHSTVRKLASPVSLEEDFTLILNRCKDYYHDTLKQSPEALAYLKARGLDQPEIIEHFQLGFANRTLGLRLPPSQVKSGAQLRKALHSVGIIRDSGHEHFNGSLVIPIKNEAGNVTGMYGRKIRDDLRTGTPTHLYLPGPHRGVFNLDALKTSKEIILCEALIDALTFWAHGFRNVTSAYGIEGFTDELLDAFQQHGTQRVLIAFDRDEAGERGAQKVAAQLMGIGVECFRVQFPKGMDANEYALKVQPAARSLGLVIRSAVWLGKGAAPVRVESTAVPVDPVASAHASPAAPETAAPVVAIEPAAVEVCAAAACAEELPPSSLAADAPASPAAPPPIPSPAVPAEPAAAEPILPASPVPALPATAEAVATVTNGEVVMSFGDRRWRVRGLSKNLSPELLKVNLLVSQGDAFHVDTLDLYAARARAAFAAQAAAELRLSDDILRADLGRVLLKLEALQETQLREALEPKAPPAPEMDPDERAEALALLTAPDLLDRIAADLTACGLVGEPVNKLTAYLAATSRLLDKPLAVMVRASSAAGKSSLMDAVLALMPDDESIKYSAMSPQALYYLGQTNLKHKILALAEEEGAARASYALKLLQSEGELTMASTGKDPATGNLVTLPYKVEGPVMLFTTTTAVDLDDELLNRCLVLTVDEGREQTQAIHAAQRARRTLDGIAARAAREDLRTVHRNAQRLLRPLAVLNPYADRLSFPCEATRTRRAHEHYLTLIDTIALLHQHQRAVKTATHAGRIVEYVEVTADDIARANVLAHEVLGRSLDELPPQTRGLLRQLLPWVAEQAQAKGLRPSDLRFSRRQVREAFRLGDTQAKVHIGRLVELEYLVAHRAGTATDYELVYDGQGQDGRPFVPGLIDAEALRPDYDPDRAGQNDERSGSGRPPVGPRSGGGRPAENVANADGADVSEDEDGKTPESHILEKSGEKIGSYSEVRSYPLAAAKRRH